MAAIGFKLQALTQPNRILGLMQAYTYAGLVGAGPWICSATGIVLVGVLTIPLALPGEALWQFQASTTYLIAASLMLTGPWQFALTRFTSDRLYDKRVDMILPNFTGAALFVTTTATLLGGVVIICWFRQQSLAYQASMLAGFVVLSNIWPAAAFLSSVRRYSAVLWSFLVGYTLSTITAVALHRVGLAGLVLGFVTGQAVLLVMLLWHVYRAFGRGRTIAFDLLRKGYRYPSLMLIGLLYNVATWADKILFWYTPGTGQAVIGPLNASLIHDAPVFLGYLAIVPGMAVFLVRMETEFIRHYKAFYGAVRERASLERIQAARNGMVEAFRGGLFDIVKVQSVVALLIFAGGARILEKLGLSTVYLSLLCVQVIAASLQLLFLASIGGLLYLDRRRSVLALTLLLAVLNAILTAFTLTCTPLFYGYGFAVALLITVLVSLWTLDRRFESLEYETYMLQ